MRRSVWAVLAVLVLTYSAAHFVNAGIRFPLERPNLGQVEEEIEPLLLHYKTGEPFTTNNPRQYGPVFLFVADPLLRWAGGDVARFSAALYVVGLLTLAASCGLTAVTLWPLVPATRRLLTAVLFIVL